MRSLDVYAVDSGGVSLGIVSVWGLVISTTLPGGASECSFNIHGNIHIPPVIAGVGYEIRVLDSRGVVWSGRVEDLIAHKQTSGEYWQVKALGWGINLDDQVYDGDSIGASATDVLADNVIDDLTQKIDIKTITATGYTLVTNPSMKLLFGRQVLSMLKFFGDSSYNSQLWYVYPRDNNDIEFTWKPRSSTPDVYIYLDDMEEFSGGMHGARLANRVTVRYNAGASYVTENADGDGTPSWDTVNLQGAGPAGWGFIRTATITLPDITSATDATQVARSVLRAASQVRLAAVSMKLRIGARITNHTLTTTPEIVAPWRVRSGMVCQIADLFPGAGVLGTLSWNNSFLIVGTTYNDDDNTLTLTAESHDLTLDQIVAQSVQLLAGRYTVPGGAA